jgi:hypothetical protein
MTTLTVTSTTLTVPTLGAVWWRDEQDWSPIAQSVTRVFGGAAVIQEAPLTGARAMTLAGGEPYAVLDGTGLAALLAMMLSTAGVQIEVALDDGRRYTCTPSRADGSPVRVRPLEAGGPGSPVLPVGPTTWWWLDEIRLLIVAGPLPDPEPDP